MFTYYTYLLLTRKITTIRQRSHAALNSDFDLLMRQWQSDVVW